VARTGGNSTLHTRTIRANAEEIAACGTSRRHFTTPTQYQDLCETTPSSLHQAACIKQLLWHQPCIAKTSKQACIATTHPFAGTLQANAHCNDRGSW